MAANMAAPVFYIIEQPAKIVVRISAKELFTSQGFFPDHLCSKCSTMDGEAWSLHFFSKIS
jgi:hypothetical protein